MHEEKGMTVAAILETKGTEVLTARADQKVSDVLTLLAERRIGAVPVMDGDTVVGVFSERDIIYGLAKDGPPILALRDDQTLTAPAVTFTRAKTALSAPGLITRRRIRPLPELEYGRQQERE